MLRGIIKVDKSQVLNEDIGMTYGYAMGGCGINNQNFSYEIRPLATPLNQQGNDPKMASANKAYKYFIGDYVKGVGLFDDKEYEGIIKHIEWGKNSKKPICVYMLDYDTNKIIPMKQESIRKIDNSSVYVSAEDFSKRMVTNADYNFQKISPVNTLCENIVDNIRKVIEEIVYEFPR